MLILFKINRKETRTRPRKRNADNDVKTYFFPVSTINLLENVPSVVEHEEQKNKKKPTYLQRVHFISKLSLEQLQSVHGDFLQNVTFPTRSLSLGFYKELWQLCFSSCRIKIIKIKTWLTFITPLRRWTVHQAQRYVINNNTRSIRVATKKPWI